MITRISIQLNQSLVCGGCAFVERDGQTETIFFDVVKSFPIAVIVGSRGKQLTDKDADFYEKSLLELFLKHDIPLKIGAYAVSA
ncbi:hypothetical protein BK120_23045 [Paenibacillus sp. FSL A5-0031]|uniref:hypothetical protein n=1 Tax=Paenibacillus sp. FSL A5-0031 TaxID=1920420 RepID=UPI00097B96CB|nr:hypothetical protein [Paenibacillus sp. FSL A5-0031]OME78618.1 hypothetical protein BK120_23045 [Paenibacillus sp. FSL A5-0031]